MQVRAEPEGQGLEAAVVPGMEAVKLSVVGVPPPRSRR